VFVEAVQQGASHALSSCLLHNPTNAVYIKRSHPTSSASSVCIFILATLFTLGSLDKLPAYCTSSPLPQALFVWQVYRSSVTSRPQTDAKNSPSCQVSHRYPTSILTMSIACTAPNQAIRPSSNLHSGKSHVSMTTRLNSPLANRNYLCVRHKASISNCMYSPIDHQRKYDGMMAYAEQSNESFFKKGPAACPLVADHFYLLSRILPVFSYSCVNLQVPWSE